MSLHREARPVIRRAFFFTLLVLACRSETATGPDNTVEVIPPPKLAAVVCKATPSTLTVECALPSDPTERTTSLNYGIDPNAETPNNAIFGGNHTNVEVVTSNITNDAASHHFGFDLTLKNLSVQPIGTIDGVSSDGSLSIFFHSGPTTTGGSGIVTVFNPTGFGTFTGAGQPYFKYGEMLAQNQTSAPKNWILDYAPTVTSFTFVLLISASLQFPDGYIDVYPKTGAITVPGGTFQLEDTVRNGLGAVNSLQKVTWSSSNSNIATVDSLGLVTGITLGSVTITAIQSLKTGTAIVQVLPPTPPLAVNDTTASNSAPGDPFHAVFNTTYVRAAPGVLANDNLGAPLATVTSFGGDSLGGLVTGHAAGSAVSPLPGHADGSLTINANGSLSFTPPTAFTGYYQTSYRISNGVGTSDAKLRVAVGVRPSVSSTIYEPHLLANVGINTSNSTQTKVGATGDALSYTVVPDTTGQASIHSDGTFEFIPKVGKIGVAAFSFHVSNGFGATPDANVKLTVDGPRIWFVDSAAAAGGDGRYGSPFNCIAGCVTGVAGPGDIIHIRRGTYISSSWGVSINSRVIGEGASGQFSDSANANVTWPADAGSQPATGGVRPILHSGVQNVMTPGQNTVIRGLILGTAPAASLATVAGPVTMSEVAIVNGLGAALNLQGAGALNISLDSIKSGPSAISAAISLSDVQGTVNSTLTKIIAPLEAVTISGGNASVNLGAGLLQSPTAEAVKIVQSAAIFSFAGSISNSLIPVSINGVNGTCGTYTFSGLIKSTQKGIDIRNCGSGTILFSGPDTLSTGTNTAIFLLEARANIQFTGGALSATTTTGFGIFAQKSRLTVTGANNSLSSAGGVALALDSVTSFNGLTFRSISANGGPNGIVLTGFSTPSFVVTGNTSGNCGGQPNLAGSVVAPDIADCSGGTIENMTGGSSQAAGSGIWIRNASRVSFNRMRIRNNANYGIKADIFDRFALRSSYVTKNGAITAVDGTGGIYLYNGRDTATIENSYVDSGAVNNVFVNSSSRPLVLTINQNVIGNDGATTGLQGVLVRVENVGSVNAAIANSRFLGSRSVGARLSVTGSGTANFSFTGNLMTNNHSGVVTGHNAVVVEASGTAGSFHPTVRYNIANNTINNNTSANQSGNAIGVFKGPAGNGLFSGLISGNTIGSAAVARSGSALGNGIAATLADSAADTVFVHLNVIHHTAIDGIHIVNDAPNSAGSLVAAVTSNTVSSPDGTSLNPIAFLLGPPSSTGKNCLTIGGAGLFANTVSYSSILLDVRTTTPVGLPGLVGSPSTYITAQNNGALTSITLGPGALFSSRCP